jgi:superfamily II DNA or RNA helicase
VLVLSARVTHCELLANRMKAAGVAAAAVTGVARKAERSRTMEQFRDGSLKVLFATSLADEGLDVSRLERLVLATPARAEGRTIQRLGRLMRPHPGKQTPILYDLVDGDDLSQKQFLARRRAYRKVLGIGAVEPIQERA